MKAPTRLHCVITHITISNTFEVFDILGCYEASLGSLLVPYLKWVLAGA